VFDETGRFLAVGGAASPLQVWDLADWTQLCPGGRALRGVRCLALMQQEQVLITTDGLIDLDRYEYAATHDRDGALEAVSPDMMRALWGRKLGYLSAEETIAELNISEGQFAAAFSSDGAQIAAITDNSESEGAELKVWDARSGAPLWSSDRFDRESTPGAFAFSRDGRHLAYPAGNGTVHIIRIPLPPPQPE
jgi:WD40 repeat protein